MYSIKRVDTPKKSLNKHKNKWSKSNSSYPHFKLHPVRHKTNVALKDIPTSSQMPRVQGKIPPESSLYIPHAEKAVSTNVAQTVKD